MDRCLLDFKIRTILAFLALLMTAVADAASCPSTVTTASGKSAPSGPLCANQLIFNETLANLNWTTWTPEVSLKNYVSIKRVK